MSGYTLEAYTLGFEELKEKLRAAPQMVAEVKYKMVAEMVNIARQTADDKAPTDTGNLRANLRANSRVVTGGGDIYGEVGVTIMNHGAPYGIYQEYGTGAFAEGPGGSRGVKVRTGGIRPKFYLRAGMEAVKAKISEVFDIGKQIIDNLK